MKFSLVRVHTQVGIIKFDRASTFSKVSNMSVIRSNRLKNIYHAIRISRFLIATWPFFAASGSGSVIGRDPLPPRAVSTSHLPERTLTQPPAVVESTLSSTLPLPRTTTGGHRQQQHLPIDRSSPQEHHRQHQRQRLQPESQIFRASSNGDIGISLAQYVFLLVEDR